MNKSTYINMNCEFGSNEFLLKPMKSLIIELSGIIGLVDEKKILIALAEILVLNKQLEFS